jgi:hypothetical protein
VAAYSKDEMTKGMVLSADEQKAAMGEESSLAAYGNADARVSPYLKAWIAQPDKDRKISTCVVGLIGDGTSRSLQANWNSPFEQGNLGGMFEKMGDVLQATTGRTSITTFSSTQIWEGNRPTTFQLVLKFYALFDAYREVMEPLRELEKMMGPIIEAGSADAGGVRAFFANAVPSPNSRIPAPVMLNIGRRMMIPNCVIESISIPLDQEKTKDGDLVRAEATLSIATKVMLNKANIAATWP